MNSTCQRSTSLDAADAPVRLTRKEFDLLRVLDQNAGRIVTHRQLHAEVWGKARFITNEPGVGYRLLTPE